MIFLKKWRRRRIVSKSFPNGWKSIIHENVVHERLLSEKQRSKLRRLVQVFVAEKNWEGCGGLALTEEMQVTIAAQACLLVVGMNEDIYFDRVLSILVYPTAYLAPDKRVSRAGVVTEGDQERLGEAWYRGPVVLSWSDALAGGRRESPGHNVVLHEFAHQLDMMNGRTVDGTPLLPTNNQLKRWSRVMHAEFQQLVNACQEGRRGCIDCYGATNEGEFFAVLTESFFERARELRANHKDAYGLLRDYFQLDPAAWY